MCSTALEADGVYRIGKTMTRLRIHCGDGLLIADTFVNIFCGSVVLMLSEEYFFI